MQSIRRTLSVVSRADVIRRAFHEYHAGRITLAQLLRVVAQWRSR